MTYHLENNIKTNHTFSRSSSSSTFGLSERSEPAESNSWTKQRVRVVVRVRPPILEDYQETRFSDCTSIEANAARITIRRNQYEERTFQVDHVLSQEATQEEVYDTVATGIVSDVCAGYNGTVLAYGQTATGKSFTVFGPGTHWVDYSNAPENGISDDINTALLGLIPRAVYQIFEHIKENNQSTEFRVTVSFLQIYMERVMDLLDVNKDNLQIREDPKYGTFVDGITTIVVQEPQDVIMLIKEGAKNRAIGSTNMNKVSSRSHVILTITVEQRSYSDEDGATLSNLHPEHGAVKRGTLTLVDLAGSERVGKSLSEGQSLEEAKMINKSLSALGNCVSALTDENRSHVPFRDSKLTKLLTDSLGGNAKTCLIATIGPAAWNYDETYSTLNFATRAMAVKNNARINETVDFKTLSGNLQKKISLIESEKYRLMARNVDLEREVEVLRNTINNLGENMGNRNLSHPQNNPASTSTAGSSSMEGNKEWETRERELVQKFTNIIHHLQMEIAKQNMIFASQAQGDGDQIIDQLVNGFLAIPVLKQKLLAKLYPEDQSILRQNIKDTTNSANGQGSGSVNSTNNINSSSIGNVGNMNNMGTSGFGNLSISGSTNLPNQSIYESNTLRGRSSEQSYLSQSSQPSQPSQVSQASQPSQITQPSQTNLHASQPRIGDRRIEGDRVWEFNGSNWVQVDVYKGRR